MTTVLNPAIHDMHRRDWNFDRDYKIAYHETDDPRIVAVIRRDDETTLSESMDGDAINPTYWREYRGGGRLHFTGGYDDSTVAEAWTNAYQRRWGRDSEEFADRFVHVFYGATVAHRTGGYNPDGEVVCFDTPAYREHIGDDPANVSQQAADETAREASTVLDGDVYGIGYAVSTAHRTNETPIDLDDPDQAWDVQIQCWGFIGDDYAQQAALAFEAGQPDLPPMLDGTNPTNA